MTGGQVLVFHRGGARFAVPLEGVRRVVKAEASQGVPAAAPGVLGMTESAGIVYTLVSTALPANLPALHGWSRWLLLKGSAAVGLLADDVEGVRDAREPQDDDLPEVPPPAEPWEELVTRQVLVDGAPTWLLDVEALIRAADGPP